jgi:ribonuclease-3
VNFQFHIYHKIKLFFDKDKELYFSLYKILGFYPNNINIYQQALLHKSFNQPTGNQSTGKSTSFENNERLEFLGDAIINAIVSDILFQHFPNKREGFLTVTRSKIVQRGTLNHVSTEIGLDKLVKECTKHLSHNNNISGNAFEALVGAAYLDKGYDTCMYFLHKRILKSIMDIDTVARKEVNFKSHLLEWGQKQRLNITFNTVEAQDKNLNPIFKSTALIDDIEGGQGQGFSKKESQQKASQTTLILLSDNLFATKIKDYIKEKQAQNDKEEETIDEHSEQDLQPDKAE